WGCPSACYVLFEKRRWALALKKKELRPILGVYDPKRIYSELKDYESRGNEIGLQASFDSWNSTVFLCREKEYLRDGGFSKVTGVRTHYLNFDPKKSPRA